MKSPLFVQNMIERKTILKTQKELSHNTNRKRSGSKEKSMARGWRKGSIQKELNHAACGIA